MADGILNMGQQFAGLPMADLIGSPLRAACDAQLMLAQATATFIKEIGFNKDAEGKSTTTRLVNFSFNKPIISPEGVPMEQEVNLAVPMLAIVSIPNLSVKNVDITFDMEVKSSAMDKSSLDMKLDLELGLNVGPLSLKVTGNVTSHKENTRSSDNSAKYHVQVQARDDGMPEGLSRVLDIFQSIIVPVDRGAPKEIAA